MPRCATRVVGQSHRRTAHQEKVTLVPIGGEQLRESIEQRHDLGAVEHQRLSRSAAWTNTPRFASDAGASTNAEGWTDG